MFRAFQISIPNFYETLAWTQFKVGFGPTDADKMLYWEFQVYIASLQKVFKTVNEKQDKGTTKQGGSKGMLKKYMPRMPRMPKGMSKFK